MGYNSARQLDRALRRVESIFAQKKLDENITTILIQSLTLLAFPAF